MTRTTNVVKAAIAYTAVGLARLGLIDEARGRRIADLSWPRVVTGLARKSQTTADLAMVGLAVGPAAIAGVGFAMAYVGVAVAIGFSLANGAMTFLSQRFGADDADGVDLAFKQVLWVELVLAVVLTATFVAFAEPLVRLLGAGPDAVAHGAVYLRVIALALLFELPVKVASRALLSANDAWSPMVVRATGAVGNVLLNVFFIFGLDLGVLGAALGTVLATVAVFVAFAVGLVRGRLPVVGELPVRISVAPPYVDLALGKQILEVGVPLMGKQFVSRGSHFAMLAIVASFGTVAVAAYAVAREIRNLMNTPAWGFNTAARSLIGQELGADDEHGADAYGRDILRFTAAVYALMSVLMFAFAAEIASLFTSDPQAIAAAVPFITVMAVSLLGLGIDEAASGIIGGAGDTRWPLYARLVGLYAFMLPIAYLGTVTQLGYVALYLAITAETVVPAAVTFYRFQTGRWKSVSRRYRLSTSD